MKSKETKSMSRMIRRNRARILRRTEIVYRLEMKKEETWEETEDIKQ